MRRSFAHPMLIGFATVIGAIGVFGIGGPQTAWAQGQILPGLFAPGGSELLPGGKAKLKEIADSLGRPGECPRRTATFRVGDMARKHAIDTFFSDLGVGFVLWGVNVGPSWKSEPDDVEVSIEDVTDEFPPTLAVIWTPPNRTKVKPDDKIRVDITATDNWTAWETGIQKIQILANIDPPLDHQLYDHEAYGGPKSKCKPEQQTRSWWRIYTVPRNPPPIVRLEVRAEDFVGRDAKPEMGEFPTGDWYGTIEWTGRLDHPGHFAGNYSGSMDLALEHDGKGNLAGQVRGTQKEQSWANNPTCPVRNTVTDGRLSATLVGSYTEGRKLVIEPFKDIKFTPPQITEACPGGIPAPSVHDMFPAEFRRLLSDLQPTPDGGFQSRVSARLSGPAATTTMNAKLTLRPAVK